MLVRDVRNWQRAGWVRAVACAAAVSGGLIARPVVAQQPANPLPATHTVKRGDTLWDIAKTYLGDAYLWPEIYRNNTDVIEDPHWIYPGEVLKLPGQTARVVAVSAPTAEPTTPAAPMPSRAPALEPAVPTVIEAPAQVVRRVSAVRVGEYAASPWVDQRGGPKGAGYIMQAADLPGTASTDQSQMHLYDKLFFAPPVGAVAPERELYLSYRLGPMIEQFGQIVIPTGVIEVTRAPRNGEAATAKVVKMFGTMVQGQFLIPYDSAGAVVSGTPYPVINGRAGKVRWIAHEPVLPTMQDYVIVDIAKRDGVQTGDQIELFQERQKPVEGKGLIIPEVSIAHAQILRVTPYGATAIIMTQEQPKIVDGTAVRVAAKMP